jgi:hypothetical protein
VLALTTTQYAQSTQQQRNSTGAELVVQAAFHGRLEWRLAEQRTHLMGKSRTFLVPVCIDETRDADAVAFA